MFVYCRNNPAILKDLNGAEPTETIDTDGDGEPDFYVYNYSSEKIIIVEYIDLNFCPYGLFIHTPTPHIVTVKVSGRVYVAPFSEEPSLPDGFGDNDVLVLDNRNHLNDAGESDPGYRICESYKITDRTQQREILKAVFDYDSCYPSQHKWKHTISTALQEWAIHNWAYYGFRFTNLSGIFNEKIRKCADVDIDNDDIGKGFLDYLGR